jgi:hypothetical protein
VASGGQFLALCNTTHHHIIKMGKSYRVLLNDELYSFVREESIDFPEFCRKQLIKEKERRHKPFLDLFDNL